MHPGNMVFDIHRASGNLLLLFLFKIMIFFIQNHDCICSKSWLYIQAGMLRCSGVLFITQICCWTPYAVIVSQSYFTSEDCPKIGPHTMLIWVKVSEKTTVIAKISLKIGPCTMLFLVEVLNSYFYLIISPKFQKSIIF